MTVLVTEYEHNTFEQLMQLRGAVESKSLVVDDRREEGTNEVVIRGASFLNPLYDAERFSFFSKLLCNPDVVEASLNRVNMDGAMTLTYAVTVRGDAARLDEALDNMQS